MLGAEAGGAAGAGADGVLLQQAHAGADLLAAGTLLGLVCRGHANV